MLFRSVAASLLVASAIAAPVESTTQATQAAQAYPGVTVLQQAAGQLSGAASLLRAFNGNPAAASQIARQIGVVNQGINIAADQISQGPGLDLGSALSFLPVITSLIGGAKQVTDAVVERRQYFQPQQIAGVLDQSVQAVTRLKGAFDAKLPDQYNFIVNGLADGTLINLSRARDLFASSGYSAAGAYSPYQQQQPYYG